MAHTSAPPSQDARHPAPARPHNAPEDRLAGWISDLTTLQSLTERIGRTSTLRAAIEETLRAGAQLLGARRGLLALGGPADGPPPAGERLVGLGLDRSELGQWETVPRGSACHTRLLDGLAGGPGDDPAGRGQGGRPTNPPGAAPRERGETGEAKETGEAGQTGQNRANQRPGETRQPGGIREISHHDIARAPGLHPRHRAVAARLGCAASYALPLAAEAPEPIGAALWLFDQPGQPEPRQRQLLSRYLRHAARHIAGRQELGQARDALATVREGLLPARLPRVPGVELAARQLVAPRGTPVCWDALALPDGGLGLAVGAAAEAGPAALAATGRLRAGLRAYAVMEGEDPVAVLADLELLLRLTEPGRPATALYGYAEPATRRLLVASAGHPPPLVVGERGAEFADTALSAPLNMLACWEAPSVGLELAQGETVLLYSEGLLRRAGGPLDAAFAGLRAAARGAPPAARAEPGALLDHLLAVLPAAHPGGEPADTVLLAARFG